MALHKKDFSTWEKKKRAAFINSLNGVKSANLIGTIDQEGQHNLAIFSSCTHLGSDPALLALISRPDSATRHTLENIEKVGAFTINHINEEIFKKAHQTSARYPKNISEFEATGLTPEFLHDFKAPFVAEAHVKLAMELREIVPLKINGTKLIIGEVVWAIFPEGSLTERGHLDIVKAKTIGVTGLDHYHRLESISALSYAKPDQAVREI